MLEGGKNCSDLERYLFALNGYLILKNRSLRKRPMNATRCWLCHKIPKREIDAATSKDNFELLNAM